MIDGDGRRLLKTVHSGNGKFYPSDSEAASSKKREPPLYSDDPISAKAVEAGFTFDFATVYIGDSFEKTTSDGVNWQDVKYFFTAGQRIAKIDASGVHYFHRDHLGSTNVVTDENGDNNRELAHHMPFGALWDYKLESGAPTKYKFTDQELDFESGLYDYGARLYDPVLARFTSPDSIIPRPSRICMILNS